ncbi:hypothetical protein NQZ68_038644 [Dissostichus eleginoides]|nr:hypothetical protein NQZ68_038644 [Dissostichus eleginoides]
MSGLALRGLGCVEADSSRAEASVEDQGSSVQFERSVCLLQEAAQTRKAKQQDFTQQSAHRDTQD